MMIFMMMTPLGKFKEFEKNLLQVLDGLDGFRWFIEQKTFCRRSEDWMQLTVARFMFARFAITIIIIINISTIIIIITIIRS